jgi:hypothetical protein
MVREAHTTGSTVSLSADWGWCHVVFHRLAGMGIDDWRAIRPAGRGGGGLRTSRRVARQQGPEKARPDLKHRYESREPEVRPPTHYGISEAPHPKWWNRGCVMPYSKAADEERHHLKRTVKCRALERSGICE